MAALFQTQLKKVVSVEQFERLVRERAFLIWVKNEPMRRKLDWANAEKRIRDQRGGSYFSWIRDSVIAPIAQEVSEARKDADSVGDWLAAEKEVGKEYEAG